MLQIVLYGTSSRLRKQALRDPKMTLQGLLVTGRQLERSNVQARHIEEDKQELQREDTNINLVKTKASANTCRNCGEEWPHTHGPCPAKGKQCRNCNKFNHFAKLCRSPRANIRQGHTSKQNQPRRRDNIRPVQTAEDKLQSSSESDESDYCYAVNTNYNKATTTKLKINGKNVKFTVDTGSTINIIDENTFKQLQNINLQETHVRAYPFNSSKPVQMTGKFDTLIESRKRLTIATIYVTAQDGGCLLSNTTAQELGLISLLSVDTRTKASSKDKGTGLSTIKDEQVRNILHKRSKVYQGVGKLNNRQIELLIDKSVKPVAQRQRKIPFHLRAKVDSELNRLQQEDIIEKVPDNEETDWISPVVIVPKQDEQIRLCVDMRAANTAIKRVCHPIPTVRDISLDLNGAKYFSKLDMSQAYHQLELTPSSRKITTFTTHAGLYRFKRLNYGTNSAAEIFQNTL